MKPLFYSTFFVFTLADPGWSPLAVLGILTTLIVLGRILSSWLLADPDVQKRSIEPPSTIPIGGPPRTSCIVTTPCGGLVQHRDVASVDSGISTSPQSNTSSTNSSTSPPPPTSNGSSVELTDGTSITGGTTPAAGGSAPRRQRSLRERAGIDGRLDKLHQPSAVLPNRSTYLSPSPSVSDQGNAEFSRPVKKVDFAEHVRFMSQDNDSRFVEEYQDLSKVGKNQTCTAADLTCNRGKNRFANILPYDRTRVELSQIDSLEGSDYINASYISGYNGPKEFISTQGPLQTTRDDFWRMVWEQGTEAIVNLTRCSEKGREKCDQYWPSDLAQSEEFGSIRVQLIEEKRQAFGTIRELRMTRNDQNRLVRHFHFTAWPDFGVPERPQKLVRFIRAFRAQIQPHRPNMETGGGGPIVVHCSAGVGRSGTLIAIDRILQHMRDHDYLDVYGLVYEMRKERIWMVQTEQQYIFIHHCLLCVLEGREDEIDLDFDLHIDPNANSPITDIPHGSPF